MTAADGQFHRHLPSKTPLSREGAGVMPLCLPWGKGLRRQKPLPLFKGQQQLLDVQTGRVASQRSV